jgi:hypothetical protein
MKKRREQNHLRCIVCNKPLSPHHKCPRRLLKVFDRQKEELIEPPADFVQRLEDAFEMARMSQNYNG